MPGLRTVPEPRAPLTGFEPATSTLTEWRASRLLYKGVPEHPMGVEPIQLPWEDSRLPLHHGCIPQSAQWESNPHIRHGKAVGCRYIMGANFNSALGRSRTCSSVVSRRHATVTSQVHHTPTARAVGVEPTPDRFGGGRAAVTPHPCMRLHIRAASRARGTRTLISGLRDRPSAVDIEP